MDQVLEHALVPAAERVAGAVAEPVADPDAATTREPDAPPRPMTH